MIKAGFIDYYLDEWHANTYISLLKKHSGGEVQAAYAWAKADSPQGGLTTDGWCAQYGLTKMKTVEELVEASDVLLVLAPRDPWIHEELCQIPLRSGKRCYVDKTFAPDYSAALRIFEIADKNGTPCWSSSALRFANEYREQNGRKITGLCSWGPEDFENYAIHQLEPIMMLMDAPAAEVMYLPGDGMYHGLIRFTDGRTAALSGFEKGSPFLMNLSGEDENRVIEIHSDYFGHFMDALTDFFLTGRIPVSHEDTLRTIAVWGALHGAMDSPGQWLPVPGKAN